MDFNVYLTLLFLCSVITSLAVEATKNLVNIKTYNLLAAIWSIVVAAFVAVCYAEISSIVYDYSFLISVFCLVFGSWLCSQLGYDKVKQALEQLREG